MRLRQGQDGGLGRQEGAPDQEVVIHPQTPPGLSPAGQAMKQLYSYYCSIIISTSSSYIQNTVLCSYSNYS
jgi:hypothetical protein